MHWETAKRVVKYVNATCERGLNYKRSDDIKMCRVAFSDTDWTNDLIDRHSTTSTTVLLADGPVIFASREQSDVALSSTHAEYYAACDACCELKWLGQLLGELNVEFNRPKLLIDNHSAIFMIANMNSRRKCKYIDIRHHFIREQVQRNLLSI